MALWQIGFFILPQDCLSEVNSSKISEDYTFDDAPFWKDHKTSVSYFHDIEILLPRTNSWADYITLFGSENSNRIEIISENDMVESVSFRIDFTSDFESILSGIIEFCILRGFIILDEKLKVVPLNYESARNVIENAPQVRKYRELNNESNTP